MIHPKHQSKWASLALLTLIGYVLSALLLLPPNAAAKGEQISAKRARKYEPAFIYAS